MRILFVAGGTAGTLSPLVAVAEQLAIRHPDNEVHFIISPHRSLQEILQSEGFPYTVFRSGKLRRYWSFRNILDVLAMPSALLRARRFLATYKPDVIVSAGSYNAVPFVWMAKTLGIRVLVHQQDRKAGLANRLTARCADMLTVVFPETASSLGSKHVEWTGNPIRQSILNGSSSAARQKFRITEGRPLLVVLGGSSGAHAINTLIASSRDMLAKVCDTIHLTGSQIDVAAGDHYIPVPFVTTAIGDVLRAADLVVTRAGIGVLSELAALSKACVIIPMPHTHQEANADYVAQHHGAVVLPHELATPQEFCRVVSLLLADGGRRQELGRSFHDLLKPHAAERIADLVYSLQRS